MAHVRIERFTFFDPVVESRISALYEELQAFAETTAKEDAERPALIPEPGFEIQVENIITHKVQSLIYFIRQHLLPTSRILDAKELDRQTKKDVGILSKTISDLIIRRSELTSKQKSLSINHFKFAYGSYLLPLALLIGFGDGALGYSVFSPVFVWYQALILSLSIALTLGISHLAYANWIQTSKTTTRRYVKIGVVLLLAFSFYWWVGSLRAAAINNLLDIAVPSDTVAAVPHPPIRGWTFCIISFSLFATVFALSMVFWKSSTDRQQEAEYHAIVDAIAQLDEDIAKHTEEKRIRILAAANKIRDARLAFDYTLSCFKKCNAISTATLSTYMRTYSRYRDGEIPAFFTTRPKPVYDENLHFFSPENMQHV